MENEKALVFDIMGNMAHFRTYYTNSSSISYGFPSRTVVTGMIGAILGYERDTYYDVLSPKSCSISVSLLTPIRKMMQSVNYIRSKKGEFSINAYLNNKLNTYPISIEFVLPRAPEDEVLRYRISFSSNDVSIYNLLKDKLETGKSFYPLYFGITELLAEFEYIGEFSIEEPIKGKGVSSVIPEKLFHIIDFSKGESSLILERMPVNFLMDGEMRKIEETKKFIYEKNAREIPVKSYEGIFSINDRNLTWMK